MTAAFRAMDPSLEESATMSGGEPLPGGRRVTLKLAWPAILATLLVLSCARSILRGAALLGLPSAFHVFTSAIYQRVHRYPSQIGLLGLRHDAA